jgi:hypothetical protein
VGNVGGMEEIEIRRKTSREEAILRVVDRYVNGTIL